MKIKHLDLFSGIAGFALAGQRVWGKDYECMAFCDNDPYCQQLLKLRFPNTPIYEDIKQLTKKRYVADTRGKESRGVSSGSRKKVSAGRGGDCDIVTGGFPCQPFSCAGKREGTKDDRFLWGEMLRVIGEFRPRWVVAENVRGLVSSGGGMVFEQVCVDLEDKGYAVQTFIIPAVAVNAPHRRDRVWIIAHHEGKRYGGRSGQERGVSRQGVEPVKQKRGTARGQGEGRIGDTADSKFARWTHRLSKQDKKKGAGKRGDKTTEFNGWKRSWFKVASKLCRVDDGIPAGVDGFELSKARHRVERIKGLGNAIVPQVAMEIFKAIKEYDNL